MTFKVIRVFKPLQIRMFVELCSILQHFNWYSASGGHSAIDELLVWLANGGTEVSCFRSRCSGHTVLPFAAAASHVPRSEFPWESLLMSLCWGDAIITSQSLCAATDVDRQQRWNNAYACSSNLNGHACRDAMSFKHSYKTISIVLLQLWKICLH